MTDFITLSKKHFVSLFLIFSIGCSLKNESSTPSLTIHLIDPSQNAPLMGVSLDSWVKPGRDLSSALVGTTPTTLSDFGCFSVHATGPGVFQTSNPVCTSTDNYSNRGRGIFSPLVALGNTIEMTVPAGSDRRFDVYGIYPSSHVLSCGGNGINPGATKGYYLGGVSSDLNGVDVNLSIPVTFTPGVAANVTCTYGLPSTISLIPDGSTEGKAYSHTATCTFDVNGVSNNTTAPTTAGYTEFSGAEYAAIASTNGTLAFSECNLSVANTNAHVTLFMWNLTAFDLSKYSSAEIRWMGAAGHYSSTCNGSTMSLGAGGGSSPPGRQFQYYKYNGGSSPQWMDLAGTQIVQVNQTLSLGSPNLLIDSLNRLWIRIISDAPNASPYCSSIQIDSIELRLIP